MPPIDPSAPPPSTPPTGGAHRTPMRSYLKAVATWVVVLLGLGILLHLSLPYPWGDAHLWGKLQFLTIHAERYDTVFIGSSYTYRQISPRIYDAELAELRRRDALPERRMESFNLGVDGLHLPATQRLFRHLLALDLPKVRTVIVELGRFTSAVDPEIDHSPEAQCWRTPELTASMVRFLWHRPDKGVGQKTFQSLKLLGIQIESYLHFGQGLRILEFLRGDPSLDSGFLGPDMDGFYAVDRQALALTGRPLESDLLRRHNPAEVLDDLRRDGIDAFEEENSGPPNPEAIRVLLDMIAEAEADGTQLYFLVPPRLGTRYRHLRPVFDRLPAQHLIAEPADPRLHPELYELDGAADRGHLNERGARHYSRLVAREAYRRQSEP